MHSAWFDHPWISLAAKLPVGLLFAGTCLWLIAPMTLNSVLEFLRRTA
jgi:hypothetical protein